MQPARLKLEKMKKGKVLVLGALIALGLSSCIKEGETFDPMAQYEIEKPIIKEYVNNHYPNATEDENSGIWYEILEEGEPGSYEYKVVNNQIEAPTVTVKYTGKLLDGTQFDENQDEDGAEMPLSRVIQAWQIAFLPQEIDGAEVNGLTVDGLQVGAKIRIITPSIWAYRNQAQAKIPANSPLEFEIEVLNIEAPKNSGF